MKIDSIKTRKRKGTKKNVYPGQQNPKYATGQTATDNNRGDGWLVSETKLVLLAYATRTTNRLVKRTTGENHVDANETRVIANRKQVNVRETHSKRNCLTRTKSSSWNTCMVMAQYHCLPINRRDKRGVKTQGRKSDHEVNNI
jgi:hypothetical protein